MTRKCYGATKLGTAAIAEAIAEIMAHAGQDERGGTPAAQVLVQIQDSLADLFAADNDRFDRFRFYEDCVKD